MRELKTTEMKMVSGGWASSLSDAFAGLFWGAGDGAMTGMTIAGKFGGAGGFGFGGLSQLVGYAVTPVVSGIIGAIGGFMFGEKAIADVVKNYRETAGAGSVSHGGSL
ncbi:DUF5862 family protein [Enterobacter mori]|uniref:DUF5862 family protein n=1 Tax=Enterobacter mori TaxID=539813 RepID=UPI001B8D7D37|nr:hypothetical protein [Enterobacter mori]MBS3046374.1 hypothetical protein [Enterobacter mori]